MKIATTTALGLLIVIILCSCRRSPTVLRFGYKPTPGQLLGVVAVKKGFFQQQGVDVKEVVLRGGREILEAAVAGQVDVGLASSAAVIAAYSAGAQIRVIAGSSYGGGRKRLLVLDQGNYWQIRDLIGKKIGVGTGGVSRKEFVQSLAAIGYKERDFLLISRFADTDLGGILVSGAVDAIVCVEPLCSKLEYCKVARELADFHSVGLDPNSLFVSSPLLESNPGLIHHLLGAWLAAEGFVATRRPEALRLLSEASGEELGVIELACSRITYQADMPETLLKEYEVDAQLLFDEGKIKRPDLSQLFALTELKGFLGDAKHVGPSPR